MKGVKGVRSTDAKVREATGRTYDTWFKLLDKWGAKDKKHPQIARWLIEEQDVDGWWSQHLTVAYEQARGVRAPGQRADGKYAVSASKTVAVPVTKLFDAFKDETVRRRWMGRNRFDVRTTRPRKSINATWKDGSTRLTIWFESKGRGKSHVALAHEKLTSPKEAAELKEFWRTKLIGLKELLEKSAN